jgi:hypothetical protein
MKTPRELLLARHAATGPKLDALRQAAVGQGSVRFPGHPSGLDRFQTICLFVPQTLWRELVLPSRRLWSGLATIWILILVVNLSQRDPVSSVTGQPVRWQPVTMTVQMQQRLMNELLADRVTPSEADRPRNTASQPRTQVSEMVST